jgi:hypothetical protein
MKYKIIRPPLEARFHLPRKEDLFKVISGDDVKIMFQVGEDITERMWVKVEECHDGDGWTGRLDNEPIGQINAKVLKLGMKIRFHPYDVIDIVPQGTAEMAEIERVISATVDAADHRNRSWKKPEIIIALIALVVAIISIQWWPAWCKDIIQILHR